MNSDDVRAVVQQVRNGDKNLLDVLSQMIRDIGARRFNYPAQAVQPMIGYLDEQKVFDESEGQREGDTPIGLSSVVQHQKVVQEEESGPRDPIGDSVS